MRSRCWGYGNAIWIANHDTSRSSACCRSASAPPVRWSIRQSVVEDLPDMLLGRPIFYTEFMNTVGDQGDIMLSTGRSISRALYQPLQSAESIHVRFVNHERAFKFWTAQRRRPVVEDGPHAEQVGGNTLSPFVTLDAR
jgi:hypothetical protein